MPPEDADTAYLWDMLDASRTIREFIKGVSFNDYAADRQLQFAVERALEIVGEAARRVSEDFRTAHPEIPWRQIIAQRNVLAHEYGEIKQDRIWAAATDGVSKLIAAVEPLVPDAPPEA